MEKASIKLLFLVTFWLVATGCNFMGGLVEARSSTQGPPSCYIDEDCTKYCSFFCAGTGVCVDNECNCHQDSTTYEENKNTQLKRHKKLCKKEKKKNL
ncbi:hypothetical protein KY289_022176 [Solanum tuberosum]|nr:hypothetical protein KY289_022176 [Solanum tuberosum]